MSSARKFLALALAACKSKQYEEAGIFLQQASTTEGADALITELGAAGEDTIAVPGMAEKKPDAPESEEDGGDVDTVDDGEDVQPEAATSSDESDDDTNGSEEDDWGDTIEETSVSSVTRRKHTSLFHIGKILAASMSAVADDEDADDDEGNDSEDADEDELSEEADPDVPGQNLIPASFSSVKVVESPAAVRSPVKLRTE